MLHVRVASIDDADDIAQAHVQGWRVGYRGLFPDEFLDSPNFERERVDRWRQWTWHQLLDSELHVVELSGRVVGFSHHGPERQHLECDQSREAPAPPDLTDLHVEVLDNAAESSKAANGEVYGFYVHPDAWGSGAAAALMDTSVTRLAERQFTSAALWVLRDNPRARAFYAKAGWRSSGNEMIWPGPQRFELPPNPVVETQYIRSLRGAE